MQRLLLLLSLLAAHAKAVPVAVTSMGPARSPSQNAFLFNGIYQEYTYPGKVRACFSRVIVFSAVRVTPAPAKGKHLHCSQPRDQGNCKPRAIMIQCFTTTNSSPWAQPNSHSDSTAHKACSCEAGSQVCTRNKALPSGGRCNMQHTTRALTLPPYFEHSVI